MNMWLNKFAPKTSLGGSRLGHFRFHDLISLIFIKVNGVFVLTTSIRTHDEDYWPTRQVRSELHDKYGVSIIV